MFPELSAEEREKFARHLYRYGYGETVIREGDVDHSLYLLRVGRVAVVKNIAGAEKQIATIDAVNIFGEISPIIESKRTATVRVISNEAVVYKWQNLDFKAIYSNPAWAELLITRLCNDLRDTGAQNTQLEIQLHDAVQRNKNFESLTALIVSALFTLQHDIVSDSIVNSKEWQVLSAIREMTLNFFRTYWPELLEKTGEHGSRAALEKLVGLGLVPDAIKSHLKK